jgi:hypothetical protein
MISNAGRNAVVDPGMAELLTALGARPPTTVKNAEYSALNYFTDYSSGN